MRCLQIPHPPRGSVRYVFEKQPKLKFTLGYRITRIVTNCVIGVGVGRRGGARAVFANTHPAGAQNSGAPRPNNGPRKPGPHNCSQRDATSYTTVPTDSHAKWETQLWESGIRPTSYSVGARYYLFINATSLPRLSYHYIYI